MGLDISAYRQIKKTDYLFDADGEAVDPKTREKIDYDRYFLIRHNHDFKGRADDVEDGACYTFSEVDGMHAGGYVGYNVWRNDLAEFAGYEEGQYEKYGKMYPSYCVSCWNGENGPFSELINFSDCSGIIGTAVSKKLASDFADFQFHADNHQCEYFREKYSEWRRMFEIASDGGCVRFH